MLVLLQDCDCVFEVMMFHGGSGKHFSERRGASHHVRVGFSAVVDVVAHAGDEQSQSLEQRELVTAILQNAIHSVSHFKRVIPIVIRDLAIISTNREEKSNEDLAVEHQLLIGRL